MAGDDGRDDAVSRVCIGTHAAAGGGQAAASPMPAAVEADQLLIDDLLPLAVPSTVQRGRGRPAGSVNVRTNKTFQVAVSRFGDPLIATVALGNMDPSELIKFIRTLASDNGLKMGVTVMDVLRFQRDLRADAMPYGHAKRVPQNDKGDDVVPILVMGGGAGSVTNVAIATGSMSIEDRIEAERIAKQNQIDSGLAADVSHDEKSHED